MSERILIVAIFITVNNWVVGQSLIEPIGQITKQDIAILEKRVMASDYQSVAINLNVLKELEGKNIPISFFDLNTTVVRDRMEVRGLKSFSWFGKNEDNLTSVILTVRGDDIQGTIIHKIEIFKIQTIGKRYFIVKVDQSKYPDEECTIVDEFAIYPNPSKGQFSIAYPFEENRKYKIHVYNNFGRIIKSENIDIKNPIVNIDPTAKGIYFLMLISENEIIGMTRVHIKD